MKNICYYNKNNYICINKNLMKNSKIQIKNNNKNNNNSIINKIWSFQFEFIEKLNEFQKNNKDKFIIETNDIDKCLECNKKFKYSKIYIYKDFIWINKLKHYIKYHNYRPPHKFISFILNENIINNNGYYIKINQNQLQLFDALMTQGGYTKKFKEKHEVNYRNTEYLGYLNFICKKNKKCKLDNIKIINSEYFETNDKSIFIPSIENSEASKQSYIFHTHPPTPTPGGRAKIGIVYEFPSSSDLLNYIYLYNKHMSIFGSIVVAPEGIYIIQNISKQKYNYKINNDLKLLYKTFDNIIKNALLDSHDKYHNTFTEDFFYNIISQNREFINNINKNLKKNNIEIKYYPKQQNKFNNWVYGSIYLDFYK